MPDQESYHGCSNYICKTKGVINQQSASITYYISNSQFQGDCRILPWDEQYPDPPHVFGITY